MKTGLKISKGKAPLPRTRKSVLEYFRLLGQKEYAKAGRLLEGFARRQNRTEWNRGYYMALRGMLSALESDSRGYTFIKNLDEDDLGKIRKEFRDYATQKLLRPFDQGFFTAWLHYVRALPRTHVDK